MWPLNCASSIYRVPSNNPYQCIIVRCSPYRLNVRGNHRSFTGRWFF